MSRLNLILSLLSLLLQIAPFQIHIIFIFSSRRLNLNVLNTSLVHIHRKDNNSADILAKKAIFSLNDLIVLDTLLSISF